jgi:hypothetical protein
LNDETVEQAIRRHERWLAEHEMAVQQHEEAMRKHEEAMLKHDEAILKHEEAIRKHDEWREEFWAAIGAATERADRMDRRLERFERAGTRRLAALAENQATIQAGLQALTTLIDRFIRGQQSNGHE